jgi:molecular chaperone DnaJ
MDLYIILGLERGATLGDIKRAYKRLARKYHPDINPGDRMAAAQFRQIAEAYETLSDPDRRQQYDTTGSAVRSDAGFTVGFEGFDFSVSAHGADASTFGDLFADVFRQRDETRREAAAERGADLHHTLTLGFEEAIRGRRRAARVTAAAG